MKLFFKLFLISTLLISCKNSEKDKNVVEHTFKSELTKAINKSLWVYVDYKNGFVSLMEFKTKDRFEFNTLEDVDGPVILNMEGDWYIENDYISIKHDNLNSVYKWTISDDFSKIINNKGIDFTLVSSQKRIDLKLKELKAEYNYSVSDE